MNNIHEQNTLGDTKRLTKWSKTELVPQRCFFLWKDMYTCKNVAENKQS